MLPPGRHPDAAFDFQTMALSMRIRAAGLLAATERAHFQERIMSQTVASQLIGVLEQIGVKQIFGLIGDSLNPLADAVRRSQIEWVGVRHEEGAALAATGQAKLTGQLAVCAGTTGPGSNHLVAGLYEASRDHAPVLALSGDMPRSLRGTDYIQTTEPDLCFATSRSTPKPSRPRRKRP